MASAPDITAITYNETGMPTTVLKTTTENIYFVYDAEGRKWRQERSWSPTAPEPYDTNNNVEEKQFSNGLESINDDYLVLHHAEGRTIIENNAVERIEYYMKGHLRNIRLVFSDLDGYGKIDQSENTEEVLETYAHYPFGLEMEGVDEIRQAPAYQSLGYNGKERVGDNLYDYGARMYMAGIGRWNAVDPHSENYFNISPYVYVANNPLIFIDPDGRDIFISYKGQNIKYVDGQLYNSDGSEYAGRIRGFLKTTVNALNSIGSTTEGGALLSELQTSSNVFSISKGISEFKPTDHNKAYANQLQTDPSAKKTYDALNEAGFDLSGGSGGSVGWNPSGEALPTTKGIATNAITDLAHELFHGLDANRGLLDSRNHDGVKRREWQAVYRENIVRKELNLPLRTHYLKKVDPSGNILGGSGPRMLSPTNSPIKPPWYK